MEEYCDKVDTIIEEAKKDADDYIKLNIDPIAKIPNPEKLLGKPYEIWSPEDTEVLKRVYVYSPETLQTFINKKEVDRYLALSAQTRKMEAANGGNQ